MGGPPELERLLRGIPSSEVGSIPMKMEVVHWMRLPRVELIPRLEVLGYSPAMTSTFIYTGLQVSTRVGSGVEAQRLPTDVE